MCWKAENIKQFCKCHPNNICSKHSFIFTSGRYKARDKQKHKHNCRSKQNLIIKLCHCQSQGHCFYLRFRLKSNSDFIITKLLQKILDPITHNVLRLPDGFYFGLSQHCRFDKNIAIKIKNYLPKFILQYFVAEIQYELQKLIDLLSAQNKIYLVAAVMCSGVTSCRHVLFFRVQSPKHILRH